MSDNYPRVVSHHPQLRSQPRTANPPRSFQDTGNDNIRYEYAAPPRRQPETGMVPREPSFRYQIPTYSEPGDFEYVPEFTQQGRPRLRHQTAPGIEGGIRYIPEGVIVKGPGNRSVALNGSYSPGMWNTKASVGGGPPPFVGYEPPGASSWSYGGPVDGGSYVMDRTETYSQRPEAIQRTYGGDQKRPVWLPDNNNSTSNPQPPGGLYSRSGPTLYRPLNFSVPYPPPPIHDTGSIPSNPQHQVPPASQVKRVRRWTDTVAVSPSPQSHIDSSSRDQKSLLRPLIPPAPTTLSLTTSERYRRSKELAADAETGYMAGGGGGQNYRPYGGQEYRIVKENDRRVKLATGLGPTEDEEWKIAHDKAQRMRFYAEQVRQTNEQKLQSSNDSRLHTAYWKQL